MRLLAALVVAGALALAAAAPAEAQIAWTCNGAPTCGGWFRTPVSLHWIVDAPTAGCDDATISTDTKGSSHICAKDEVEVKLTIKVDRTPPVVLGAAPARPPDHDGWYTAPVAVAFDGTDATSGVDACTTTTYAAGDAAEALVEGTCTDVAGNASAPFAFPLRYDATPPQIGALAAARPPDHAGWYTAPVTVTAQGTDAVSGLAGCDPVAYDGPDAAAATVTAGCRDRAGNAAAGALTLRYDATAPDPAAIRTRPADRVVRLALPPGATAAIVREPGLEGARETRLAAAATGAFADRRVRNGRAYRYRVTLRDQAGNEATRTLRVVPGPRLRAPAAGARLTGLPLLRWTPVRGARYYNVQLERDGRKILSRWPAKARLRLPADWRFDGRRHRLAPGRYRWLVWPGKGARAEGRYGPRIGSRSFEVAAPPQ